MTLRYTRLHEKIMGLKSTSSVWPEEGARLAYLASQVPDGGNIVELGSCWGRSACYMAAALKETGKRAVITCVDLWDLGTTTPERHHHPNAFKAFEINLKSCGLWEYVRPVKSDSAAAARDWTGPIDLLFIDAGHSYAEVYGDYCAWTPFVRPGGFLIFHDYILPRHPDIVRCVDIDVMPSGLWGFLGIQDRLWTARRKEQS